MNRIALLRMYLGVAGLGGLGYYSMALIPAGLAFLFVPSILTKLTVVGFTLFFLLKIAVGLGYFTLAFTLPTMCRTAPRLVEGVAALGLLAGVLGAAAGLYANGTHLNTLATSIASIILHTYVYWNLCQASRNR